MPYSVPSVPSAAVPFPTTQGRPGHRRSFSHIVAPPTLASTNSTGAFSSLGSLPTRRRAAPPKRPTFQLGKDDDDEDSPDESPPDDTTKLTINTQLYDDEHVHLPPLRLKSKILSSFDNQPASVPFPRSSPLPSPSHTQSSLPFPDKRSSPPPDSRPVRPSVSRTSSTPILLSNGKPLKSSLKSSNSSPNIPFPPQSLVPSIMFPQLHQHSHHQRACSAPVTPHLPPIDVQSHPAKNGNASSSPPPSPLPQKNVHFPSSEEGGLTTVRVYKRSAKPASLLRIGDETETETEGESSSAPNAFGQGSPWGNRWYNGRASPYPIPKFGGTKSSPLADDPRDEVKFEIDMKNSSPVPARGAERAEGNIYFESLGFVCEAGTDKPAKPMTLTGTLLVRNISYQKTVTVRYTLDDWHTTNDVLAKHERSLAALPERFLLASLPLVEEDNAIGKEEGSEKREVVCKPYGFEDVLLEGPGFAWDRFRFDISMERFEGSLEHRSMWFVGKYAAKSADGILNPTTEGSGEEWWDNNSGGNYRIEFLKKVVKDRREASPYRRNVAFSAPPVFNPSKPFPAPPQISASQSFPISLNMPQQREHQAALAQSTLARLKRLNLMNYAAPSAVARDQPFETMETSTASTSADSTPLQTPTQDRERDFDMDVKMPVKGQKVEVEVEGHDPDIDVLGSGEGLRRTNGGFGMPMEMQNGFPATMMGAEGRESAPIEFGKGRGTGIGDDSDSVSTTPTTGNTGIEMGTSPPFSSLAGMEARRFSTNPAAGLYWPWGFGAGSEEGKKGDEAELPPATPTGSLSPVGSPEMTSLKPTVVSPSPAPSTTTVAPHSAPAHTRTSSNSSVSSPLMPPQRRKVVNLHHHQQQAQAPTFSIGRSSGSSSSTSPSSGSGSGSDTNARERWRSGTASPTTTVTPKIASPEPWPLPSHYRVTSPPPTLPRRLFVPFGMKKNSQGDDDHEEPPAPSPPKRDLSPGPGSPAQDDAVYQAFVRQWCFAQEPGPSVGAGVGVERKEDVAVR